jgi:hypothetical protein
MAKAPLTITVTGDKELMKLFKTAPAAMNKALVSEVKLSTKAVAVAYKRNERPHYKTGRLDASIVADTDDNWKSGEAGSDIPESIFREFDTKAHFITPKKAGGMLRFYWEKIGKWIALPFVAHPGTKGDHGLNRAAVEVLGIFGEKFIKRLTARYARIGGVGGRAVK